jgi:hypothetical protein
VTPTAIKRRVRLWQKRLCLADWTIGVEVGPLEDGGRAECDAKPEYREATIRLDPERITDAEVDAYCVHELLHCWTWALEKAAENWAGEDEALYESVRDTAEQMVTNLERAFLNAARKR